MNVQMSVHAVDFFATDIGEWVKAVLAFIGVAIVLVALVKSIGAFSSGKMGNGVKILLGGVVVGALCLRPELFNDVLSLVGDILEKLTNSADEVTQQSGGTAPVE